MSKNTPGPQNSAKIHNKIARRMQVTMASIEYQYKYSTLKSFQFLLQPPPDALFAHPRLFRACVPPGMHRFRNNIWDFDNRPKIMACLGYPRPMKDRIPEITEARNIELGLGLQVCTLIFAIQII